MATKYLFNGKMVKLPGAYSTIVMGDQNQPISLDYGKVLVIDTGVEGLTWGGGAGIDGELTDSPKDSIYSFNNLEEYQSFLKGGLFWKMAEALFKPDKKSGALGVSNVYHVKAATTTAATLTFTAMGGGSNGGSFKFKCKDEGVIGNGVLTATHLDKGYAYKIETGSIDVSKWVFKIFLGTWTGDYVDSISYNEVSKADSEELLLMTSPEFNNIQDLLDWANTSSQFNNRFVLDSTSAVAGDGSVDAADVLAASDFQIAVGGTESYSSTNIDEILAAVVEEEFSFIITDLYGVDDYNSADLSKISEFIVGDSKFERFLFVGGGADKDEFSSSGGSLDMGLYFNSPYVHVVHSDVYEASDSIGTGFREWPSVYHAAKILGRTAGKEPQVPITNKSIGIDKVKHSLTKAEKERALDAGVKVTVWNHFVNKFVLLQDVNTLQDNSRIFTPQGKSHQGSSMRIIAQINLELIVNAETDLLSDENGVNRNTLFAGQIKNWTENYLESRKSSIDEDNLLIDYMKVVVIRDGDSWKVNYGIIINTEINKIFFTGFVF